jgi:hypothetical protein
VPASPPASPPRSSSSMHSRPSAGTLRVVPPYLLVPRPPRLPESPPAAWPRATRRPPPALRRSDDSAPRDPPRDPFTGVPLKAAPLPRPPSSLASPLLASPTPTADTHDAAAGLASFFDDDDAPRRGARCWRRVVRAVRRARDALRGRRRDEPAWMLPAL